MDMQKRLTGPCPPTFPLFSSPACCQEQGQDRKIRSSAFSDMQSDEAGTRGSSVWETNHDVIEKDAGYELPQIVY